MAWEEETVITQEYSLDNQGGTIWDGGATRWDVKGNVETTIWDKIAPNYQTEAENTAIWTED